MQGQPILTTNWLNFWRRMKTILPKELNDMKTLSVNNQVKYSVLKLLLWLVCVQFPIQNQYIHMSKENKQQKQLWHWIFHLEGTECEWMNEATEMWKMLFLVTKHSSVENVFKLFITLHYFQSITVSYNMNKCLLWNVQILRKLKESENSLTKVQALRCVKIVLGCTKLRQKLGVLSCMNIIKLLKNICKMKELFSIFLFLIYLLQSLILWLWRECIDWVNNVCLLLEVGNWLLWEKMLID